MPSDGAACSDGPLEFVLEIESDAPREVRSLAVFLIEQDGTKVVNADTLQIGRGVSLRQGLTRVLSADTRAPSDPGLYRVGLWLADPVQAQSVSGAYDYLESAFEIEVFTRASAVPSGTGAMVDVRVRCGGAGRPETRNVC